MELNFVIREDTSAPCPKALTCFFKFVEQHMIGLGMVHPFIRSILHCLLEVVHFDLEIFKSECFGSRRPLVTSEKKWAMVRE